MSVCVCMCVCGDGGRYAGVICWLDETFSPPTP